MEGWVILELMGHVRLIGIISEVEAFGSKLGRIESLQRDGTFVTQHFGAASVYRITPTTEETGREMMKPVEYSPYSLSGRRIFDEDEIPEEEIGRLIDEDETTSPEERLSTAALEAEASS